MMTLDSPHSPGVIGTLREAVDIPCRSWKLMVSITLLALVPMTLLSLTTDLTLTPLIMDMASKMAPMLTEDPNGPHAKEIVDAVHKESSLVFYLDTIYLIAYSILKPFSFIVVVPSSAMAYTKKHLTLKELIVRTGRSLKKTMITWLYACFISIAYGFITGAFIGVLTLFGRGALPVAVIVSLTLTSVLFYIYLCALWMLGLVISVVEDDCYGLMAIERAAVLIKRKKLQGFVLMLIPPVFSMTISMVNSDNMSDIKQITLGRLATVILMICLDCIVNLFIFVVCTVFCYDCKKGYREVEIAGGLAYAPVTTCKV